MHHRDAYYCENYGICKRKFSVLFTRVNSTVFIFAALLWNFCYHLVLSFKGYKFYTCLQNRTIGRQSQFKISI